MGANAAEFQWEPSFVEQMQQACLFSFSVGDIAKEANVLCKSSPLRMLFIQGFQIELY